MAQKRSTENDFTDEDGNLLTYDQWEDRMFLNSRHYTVAQRTGPGRFDTRHFNTYPEAMLAAMVTDNAMLYVLPDSRMNGVLIARDKYEHYLKLYNKLTGHHLKLPTTKFINAVRAEMKKRRTNPRPRVRT